MHELVYISHQKIETKQKLWCLFDKFFSATFFDVGFEVHSVVTRGHCLGQLALCFAQTTDAEKNRREREVFHSQRWVAAIVKKWVRIFPIQLLPLAILNIFPLVISNVVVHINVDLVVHTVLQNVSTFMIWWDFSLHQFLYPNRHHGSHFYSVFLCVSPVTDLIWRVVKLWVIVKNDELGSFFVKVPKRWFFPYFEGFYNCDEGLLLFQRFCILPSPCWWSYLSIPTWLWLLLFPFRRGDHFYGNPFLYVIIYWHAW